MDSMNLSEAIATPMKRETIRQAYSTPRPNLSPVLISSVPGHRGTRSPSSQLIPSLAKSFAGALVALASASAAVARLTHARAETSITAARAILPLDGHSLSHTLSLSHSRLVLQILICSFTVVRGGVASY